MKESGYILVYNPISNEGHLDSWHVLFIQMLRSEGWKVIAVSKESLALKAKLVAKGLELSDNLIVYPAAPPPRTIRSQVRRISEALRIKGDLLRHQSNSKSSYTFAMRTFVLSACAAMNGAERLYR